MLFAGPVGIEQNVLLSEKNFSSMLISYQSKALVFVSDYFIKVKPGYGVEANQSISYNYTRLSIYQNLNILYNNKNVSNNLLFILSNIKNTLNNINFGDAVWISSKSLATGGFPSLYVPERARNDDKAYATIRNMGKNLSVLRIANHDKGQPVLFANEHVKEPRGLVRSGDDLSSKVSLSHKDKETISDLFFEKAIQRVSVMISVELKCTNYECNQLNLQAPLKLSSFVETDEKGVAVYYHVVQPAEVKKIIAKKDLMLFKLDIPSSHEWDKIVAILYHIKFGKQKAEENKFSDSVKFFSYEFVKDDVITGYKGFWDAVDEPIYFNCLSATMWITKSSITRAYTYSIVKLVGDLASPTQKGVKSVELFVVFLNDLYYREFKSKIGTYDHINKFVKNLIKERRIMLIESEKSKSVIVGYVTIKF